MRSSLCIGVLFCMVLGCGAREKSIPLKAQTTPQNIKACSSCHGEHYELWSESGHGFFYCTVCHGQPTEHSLEKIEPRPAMTLPSDGRVCLICHQKMIEAFAPNIGSMDEHLEFIRDKHKTKVNRDKIGDSCVFCHDPHSLE